MCALSRFETRILSEFSEKFMASDDWDVADATHEFPEYTETYAGRKKTSIPIKFEKLIEAVGLQHKQEKIETDAVEKDFFDHLFGTTP